MRAGCGTHVALAVGAPVMHVTVKEVEGRLPVDAWQGLMVHEAIPEILGDAWVTFCHLKRRSLVFWD